MEEPPEVEDAVSPVSIFNERPDILASLFEVEIYHSAHALYVLVCVCLYE